MYAILAKIRMEINIKEVFCCIFNMNTISVSDLLLFLAIGRFRIDSKLVIDVHANVSLDDSPDHRCSFPAYI